MKNLFEMHHFEYLINRKKCNYSPRINFNCPMNYQFPKLNFFSNVHHTFQPK